MTPRYQDFFLNSIFLGQYEDYDLYCYPMGRLLNAEFYFPLIAVRNNNVYWQTNIIHPAVREAMKRAQQLLSHTTEFLVIQQN